VAIRCRRWSRSRSPATRRPAAQGVDLADVVGQVEAKWACEVAAARRHHMLFSGPPGVGKTMLTERVLSLLPDLDLHDALEVSALHSLAGFHLDQLITRPPYSDPHHSAPLLATKPARRSIRGLEWPRIQIVLNLMSTLVPR
jgi:predicted ATPase with chaperone activity